MGQADEGCVASGKLDFIDRNVEKVGVNSSEAIAMDSYDVATRIVRKIYLADQAGRVPETLPALNFTIAKSQRRCPLRRSRAASRLLLLGRTTDTSSA